MIKELPKCLRTSIDRGDVESANITAIEVNAENAESDSDNKIW